MTRPAWPLVSVVLPVRNAERYLAQSLRSMWAQEFTPFELLAVDDGSTDDTLAVLARQEDRRLRVLKNSGAPGVAGALNTGLAAARGQYIARMDGDDLSLPSRLAVQVQLLERHDDVAVVGSDIWFMTADGRATARRTRLPQTPEGLRLHLHVGNCLPHPTVLARRSVLESAGGYRVDRPGAEDYDLWLRLMTQHRFGNAERPLLIYRVHAGNTSTVQQHDGAATIARPLATALSELLGRPLPARMAQRLLAPAAPVDDVEELAGTAAVLREVMALARMSPSLPARDLRSIRRRVDEVSARLLVAAVHHERPALASMIVAGGLRGATSAARGATGKLSDRVRHAMSPPTASGASLPLDPA